MRRLGRIRSMRGAAASLLGALALAPAAAAADEDGPGVYAARCAACHQASGQGTPGLAPPVAGVLAPLLGTEDGRRYVVHVLVHGLSGPIVSNGQPFVGAMPAQSMLVDAELAAAANHLARTLNGSTAPAFTAADFERARKIPTTHKELRALRAKLLR